MNVAARIAEQSRPLDYWTPEPLLAGATVFCLASGPSMDPETCRKLRGRRCIVVNSTALLAIEAGLQDEILYFMDSSWLENDNPLVDRWPIVRAWRGPIVTASRRAKEKAPDRFKLIATAPHSDRFPPVGSPQIRQARSSGHVAVALAVAMGAARIVMLGYDCRLVKGRSHHHDDYARVAPEELFRDDFLVHWRGWNAAALAAGVTVLNATPGSALAEFPIVALDDILMEV